MKLIQHLYRIRGNLRFLQSRLISSKTAALSLDEQALHLLKCEEQEAALAAFCRAIQAEPTQDWLSRFQLWSILEQPKQPSLEAWENKLIEILEAIAKRYPQERACALNLAEALTRQGHFGVARPWYRQAVENRLRLERPDLADLKVASVPAAPYFTIIGVMKGGTTSLYHYMSQHPQIFPTARKEIDFWSWRYQRGLDWYLAHFAPLPQSGNYITGDASPTYLPHRQAPQRIAEIYPNMKIIAILRNPVDRAISHYYHACREGIEHRTLYQAMRSHRQEVENNTYDPDKLKNYLSTSLYSPALARWFSYFPHEQVHVLLSEDLFQDPQSSLDRLCQFLNIPSYELSNPINRNPGKYQLNDPEIRQELREFFKPHNRQLQDLLKFPLPQEHFCL